MKTPFHRLVFAVLMLSFGAGCTTAYDSRGRPRQVVEPSTALIGAAAVGLIAYGLANSRNNRRYNNNCNYGYRGYGHPGYYPGGFYGFR
jgi:hypothetical protein